MENSPSGRRRRSYAAEGNATPNNKPEAPGADIGVSVSEGVVTMTGFVSTYSEKLAAEKAVKLVRGVRGIASDLVVRPFSQPTDTDIVKTALHTLESDVRVPADGGKSEIADG